MVCLEKIGGIPSWDVGIRNRVHVSHSTFQHTVQLQPLQKLWMHGLNVWRNCTWTQDWTRDRGTRNPACACGSDRNNLMGVVLAVRFKRNRREPVEKLQDCRVQKKALCRIAGRVACTLRDKSSAKNPWCKYISKVLFRLFFCTLIYIYTYMYTHIHARLNCFTPAALQARGNYSSTCTTWLGSSHG